MFYFLRWRCCTVLSEHSPRTSRPFQRPSNRGQFSKLRQRSKRRWLGFTNEETIQNPKWYFQAYEEAGIQVQSVKALPSVNSSTSSAEVTLNKIKIKKIYKKIGDAQCPQCRGVRGWPGQRDRAGGVRGERLTSQMRGRVSELISKASKISHLISKPIKVQINDVVIISVSL